MGYYNELSMSETRTTDDDWYDRQDYGFVQTPAAPAAPVSDLPIPRITAMIDRALDYRASAERQRDTQALRQIDRLITTLYDSPRLCWQLGTLHIVSPSGGRYQVSQAGCSCPNGQKSRARACWHWALYNLLLDLFETDAETRDQAADDRPLGTRLAAARAVYSL